MIVLDCSAATEIVRRSPRGQGFRSLMLEGEEVMSSELFHAEIRNVFWKYEHAGLIDHGQAEACARAALGLVDAFVPLEENADEAFREASLHDHSVYDLFYLTLARRKAATLFTADRRLAALCEEMQVDCVTEVPLVE